MRAAYALVAAILASGCAGFPADGDERSDATRFEPTVMEFPFSIPVGVQPLGDQDPAQRQWTFDVPEPAVEVVISGEWNCASMCPLHVTVVNGDGDVVRDRTSGSWSDSFKAPGGTWSLRVATGDQGITSSAEGRHVVSLR